MCAYLQRARWVNADREALMRKIIASSGDVEHAVFAYLPFTEVCLLRTASASWNLRVTSLLQNFPWEVSCPKDGEGDAFDWLKRLCDAKVRFRSILLVRAQF